MTTEPGLRMSIWALVTVILGILVLAAAIPENSFRWLFIGGLTIVSGLLMRIEAAIHQLSGALRRGKEKD